MEHKHSALGVLDSRCNVRELKVPWQFSQVCGPKLGISRRFLKLFRPKNLEAMCRMLGPSERRKSLGHQYFVGHPDTMDRVRYPR